MNTCSNSNLNMICAMFVTQWNSAH